MHVGHVPLAWLLHRQDFQIAKLRSSLYGWYAIEPLVDLYTLTDYSITVSISGGIGIRSCGYSGSWTCGANVNGSDCAANNFTISTGVFELSSKQLASMGLEPSASISSSAATAATATVTVTSIASASSTSSPAPATSSALPAIVGAAVGAPLALAVVALGTLFLLERKRSRHLKQQLQAQTQIAMQAAPSHVHGKYVPIDIQGPPSYTHELDAESQLNNQHGEVRMWSPAESRRGGF